MLFSALNTTLVAIFSSVIFINKGIYIVLKVDGFGEKDIFLNIVRELFICKLFNLYVLFRTKYTSFI
jgi:hypothetical protein